MLRSPRDPALPGGEEAADTATTGTAAVAAAAGAAPGSSDAAASTAAASTAAASAAATAAVQAAGKKEKEKRFHNGWNKSLEVLVAEWADKANCYRWMHDKAGLMFSSHNFYLTLPVIILSTVTGTASFGISGLLPNESDGKYAGAVIGVVSLITALIQTVANTLRYAQQSEAHRVAGVSWGKFQRFVSIELSLHPNERMDAMNFLKMARVELDRLIEQSPLIPPNIVKQFEFEFRKKSEIKRPEIAGGIEHTRIFDDRDSRVVKLASEAAFMLAQKKKYMRELIESDLEKHIVERTSAERSALEARILEEAARIARETASQTVQTRLTIQDKTPENAVSPASFLVVADGAPLPTTIAQKAGASSPNTIQLQIEEDAPPDLLSDEEHKTV